MRSVLHSVTPKWLGRTTVLWIVCALLSSTALAVPSAAQTVVPPSLAGEVLSSGGPFVDTDGTGKVITGDCNRDGTSTITLAAEGAAAGPYPGTFVEVQGTKTLVAGQASCGSGTDPVTGAVTTFVFLEAELRYEATISTADGQFTDSGTATVWGISTAAFGPDIRSNAIGFQETFTTSDGVVAVPVAPVCGGDDDDDDGGDDECDGDDDDDDDDGGDDD